MAPIPPDIPVTTFLFRLKVAGLLAVYTFSKIRLHDCYFSENFQNVLEHLMILILAPLWDSLYVDGLNVLAEAKSLLSS